MSTVTRSLLAASFALLLVTVVTGALHGLDVLRLTDDSLHASAGTLGWLTLGVFGIATVLFPSRRQATGTVEAWLLFRLPAGAMTLLVLASWAGGTTITTAAASIAFGAAIGFLAGLVPRIRPSGPLTIPQLGILAALVILVAGLAVDPVIDVRQIGDADWVPFRVAGARSPSIIAFSVLTGMAVAEWHLSGARRSAMTDTWGLAQVSLFVAGWFALLLGAAADNLNLLVSNVLFHAIAVAVFLIRLAPRLPQVRWSSGDRWFGAIVLYLAAHAGLLGHVALGVSRGDYLELALVPVWLTFAVEHVVFVGVVASALFGLGDPGGSWGRAAFRVTNLGLFGLVVGLATEVTFVSRTFAAVLGVGILVGALASLHVVWTGSAAASGQSRGFSPE